MSSSSVGAELAPPAGRPRSAPAVVLLITIGGAIALGAGNEVSEFMTHWTRQRVVVTSALYTVLYDEVGRLGRQYRGKVAGLTVATPKGQYYEFDGPGSDEDI